LWQSPNGGQSWEEMKIVTKKRLVTNLLINPA
jgi:hypothetical protein